MSNKVIIVFDANQRSALAVTRSVGAHKNTFIICTDRTDESLAGASHYCDLYLKSPSPYTHPSQFIEWVSETVARYQVELLMPVTEVSSRLLVKNQNLFIQAKLPFCKFDTLLHISDKNQLMQLAEDLDVPIPNTLYFEDPSQVEISQIEFPCVIKPALSRIFTDGQWSDTSVSVVNNEAELKKQFASQPFLQKKSFMLQEFIEGHGQGIFCLYNKGTPVSFFAHQRIREKPPSGGVSVLSKSISVDPTMRQHAEKVLSSVNWHGVAMIEFRVDNNGTPYLMEINTRFWGSLQLAVDSGANFPLQLASNELNLDFELAESYQTGNELRWLLGDLDNLYLTLKCSQLSYKQKFMAIVRFITPKLTGRRHEVNRFGDLKPALYELKQYLKALS